MRITIDIDGDTVNVTTEPERRISVNSPGGTSAATPRPTPPPGLLKAAAALGAHNAGPAPTHLAGLVKSATAAEWKALAGHTDAGAAPSGARKHSPAKSSAKRKKRGR